MKIQKIEQTRMTKQLLEDLEARLISLNKRLLTADNKNNILMAIERTKAELQRLKAR